MDSYEIHVIWVLIKFCSIVLLVPALLVLPLPHITAVGHIEEINELRRIVNSLGKDARTEDILGKVADYNMSIKSAKKYNEIPFVCLYVNNKLANTEIIEIPN